MSDSTVIDTFPCKEPVLVTCGLPYASGPLHIGHLRTYVPADVFVRLLRKMGVDATFVCGSDTHGTPVLTSAEAKGVSARELYLKYHQHYLNIFPRLNIHFDNYGSTDDPENIHRTLELVKSLQRNGFIYPKELETPYCDKCKRSLPDRFVRGECPYCHNDARGDECDQGCGRYLEPGEVLNPRCAVCGSQTRLVKRTHYYFRLTAFDSFLREYLQGIQGTKNARNYALGWVNEGLRDWCITRDLNWGVRFPGDESLVLYVWVDAPIHYISSTEQWAKKTGQADAWEKYWMPGNGKIVHFIGQDIVYHHCVFWPSMLKGSGYNLPHAVVASGMLNIGGHKFSRSRGYVVWIEDDYLAMGLDPDYLRYYMVSFTGHTRDLDFSFEAFQDKVNTELAGTFGNFIYRAIYFTKKHFDTVPEGVVEPVLQSEIRRAVQTAIDSANEYEPKRLADEVLRLASVGNNYFQSNKPWDLVKTDRKRAAQVLFNCVALIKALAILVEPIMPGIAERIWTQLGHTGTDIHGVPLEECCLAPAVGTQIREPIPLITKIEEDFLAKLKENIDKRILDAEARAKGEKPMEETRTETVTLEEFKKLDLRAGKILRVERIPKKDKLLLLTVDIGSETRTIVTGLADQYTPEELTGITALFLINLEPRKIGGVESKGMILAVEKADQPGRWLLVRLEGVPPGSKAA
ncbi:MAG: methionine--tRNA ligase [Candidatus Thorarchaeota archaeon]|nr:methionine--tRNA ligase [Candidatus Thorarchaeota archaeon]